MLFYDLIFFRASYFYMLRFLHLRIFPCTALAFLTTIHLSTHIFEE